MRNSSYSNRSSRQTSAASQSSSPASAKETPCLAMLALFLFSKQSTNKFITWAYYSFLTGIVLFSGSLYFLCTRNLLEAEWLKILGPITPVGGLFFVAGWIFIALIGLKKESK